MTSLADCFDRFTVSTARLETLPSYSVTGEGDGLRSLRSNEYLRRVARAALAGRAWTRVRVIDDPVTAYQHEQLTRVYVESNACGEKVFVVARAQVRPELGDYWLFDAGTTDARAVRLRFDIAGVPLPDLAELVTDTDTLDEMARELADLIEVAKPLAVYLGRETTE